MYSTMIQVINESIFPLFVSYLPVIGLTGVFAWIIASQFYRKTGEKPRKENLEGLPSQKGETNLIKSPSNFPGKTTSTSTNNPSKKKHSDNKWGRDSKQNFSHDWLLTSLKAHTGPVLDMSFSANGKYLATCAEDRAIFIWTTKDWKEKDHKYLRYNVDLDHANLISWSPDSKAFIYNRYADNYMEVCKITKKPDGSLGSVTKAISFPNAHKSETIGLGIAVNGRYIMSCSSGTDIILWDLKGSELTRVDSLLNVNYRAKVSPCGRFIAAAGFVPDVKVWEVVFTKSGEFKQVSRAFELQGHSAGVHDFAFNADSTKVATVSKDGSWRLFNIKIEFEKGEEPHLLKTGKYKTEGTQACMALSPDGSVLALASASTLTLVNAVTGEIDKVIPNVYSGPITRLAFDSAGEYVLTAGEKHVRIFYNVTGQKTNILLAKEKLQASGNSSATKERLQSMIEKSEKFLKKFK